MDIFFGHLYSFFVNISVLFFLVQLFVGLLGPFWLQFDPRVVPVSCCRLYFVQLGFLFLVALDRRNLVVQSVDFLPVLRPVVFDRQLRVYLLVLTIFFGSLFTVEFCLNFWYLTGVLGSEVLDFLALLLDPFFEELKPLSHCWLLLANRGEGGLSIRKTNFHGGPVYTRVDIWRFWSFE